MIGSWEINIRVGKLPQKIATAFGELGEKLIGAQYTPIAYLGSQVVNGTNHAVLAEQFVTTGVDTKNIVIIIFNEKEDNVTLVNIERVIEGGQPLGGIQIDVKTDIPEEAQAAFDAALNGFVGSSVKPVALLATQVTKGIDYIFIADVTPVTPDPTVKVALVSVNSLDNTIKFVDLLQTPIGALGYAFTWLRK